LQGVFGYRLGTLKQVGARHLYPLSLVEAEEQVRPHLVVLGNAAHSLHPIAGQGFNLSLRDAVAGRRVAGRPATAGRPGHLAGLSRAPAPGSGLTVGFSDQVTRLFGSNQPLVAGRNLGLLGLDLLPPAKRWFARQAMGLGTRPMRGGLSEQFGKARLLRWLLNSTRRTWAPASACGTSARTCAASRCAWADAVEPQLRRHPVRRQPVFDGRPVLHADADGAAGARLHRLGQGRQHRFHLAGQRPGVCRIPRRRRLLDEIRQQTASGKKYLPQLQVDIRDGAGELVARVEKPFTCGSSRKRGRLKAWKCAQIC
jgi:hypothetical protein